MSSEWLDLRADYDGEEEAPTASATAAAAALHRGRVVMRPLCMCVNQRHTRVGVGHERGYVVYRLVHNNNNRGGGSGVDDAGDDVCETHEDVMLAPQQRDTAGDDGSDVRTQLVQQRNAKRSLQRLVVDVQYSRRRPHQPRHRAATTTTTGHDNNAAATPSPSPRRVHDDNVDDSDSSDDDDSNSHRCREGVGGVGSDGGGGVAVMALLYEQPCMAVCGGGPTPLAPCNVVVMLCAGDVVQSLTLPHPVVRLALDARVLFVCTTHELRVYTNPMERQWTMCSFALPFADASLPLRPWRAHNNNSSNTSTTTATAVATALPPLPCVVDYAHNTILVRSAASANGFTLLRYVTYSAASGTGRGAQDTLGEATRCDIRVVASRQRAHRNALTSLALHIGTTSWTATAATDAATTAAGRIRNSNSSSNSSSNNNTTTVVAACSVHATRITLWCLVSSPASSASSSLWLPSTHSSVAAVFVLLREFRLAFRLPTASFTPRANNSSSGGSSHRAAHTMTTTTTAASAAAFVASSSSHAAHAAADDGDDHDEHMRVYHLQFVDDGALLLCTRADRLHVFATHDDEHDTTTMTGAAAASTDATALTAYDKGKYGGGNRRSSSDNSNSSSAPHALTHNRHSMFAVIGRVLPAMLSVPSYTQQHWAACEAALPLHDTVLLPRWLHVYKQERAAVAAAATSAATTAAASAAAVASMTTSFANNSSFTSSATAATTAFAMVRDTVSLVRSMSRLVSSAARSNSNSSSDATAVAERAANALPAVWGKTMTHLAPCMLLWQHAEHATRAASVIVSSSSSSSTAPRLSHGARARAAQCKVLLDCVTCEGSYATWRLYKDTATLHTSPAVPLARQ